LSPQQGYSAKKERGAGTPFPTNYNLDLGLKSLNVSLNIAQMPSHVKAPFGLAICYT